MSASNVAGAQQQWAERGNIPKWRRWCGGAAIQHQELLALQPKVWGASDFSSLSKSKCSKIWSFLKNIFLAGENEVGFCLSRHELWVGCWPTLCIQIPRDTWPKLLRQQQVNLSYIAVTLIKICRNQLLTDILLSCGQQIKKLIFNVCADYRSVVDCHNIIAR